MVYIRVILDITCAATIQYMPIFQPVRVISADLGMQPDSQAIQHWQSSHKRGHKASVHGLPC